MVEDPALSRALDRFTVPDLPEGFATRVAAKALATPALPALPPAMPRRFNPTPWRRRGIIIAGLAGFSVMSAAAAASGILGDFAQTTVRTAPVIGPIIARVAPDPPKKVAAAKPAPRAVLPVTPPPVAAAPETVSAPDPEFRRDLRREVIAERIVERIERRQAMRDERGLPPKMMPPPPAVREKLRQLPPEERAAVRQRVMELMREKRGLPPTLTPEEQARADARREHWRLRRLERIEARELWRRENGGAPLSQPEAAPAGPASDPEGRPEPPPP